MSSRRLHWLERAFDELLHAARTVVKAHTSRLDACVSPDAGLVISEIRSELRFLWGTAGSDAPFDSKVPEVTARIVTSAVIVDHDPVVEAVTVGIKGPRPPRGPDSATRRNR